MYLIVQNTNAKYRVQYYSVLYLQVQGTGYSITCTYLSLRKDPFFSPPGREHVEIQGDRPKEDEMRLSRVVEQHKQYSKSTTVPQYRNCMMVLRYSNCKTIMVSLNCTVYKFTVGKNGLSANQELHMYLHRSANLYLHVYLYLQR